VTPLNLVVAKAANLVIDECVATRKSAFWFKNRTITYLKKEEVEGLLLTTGGSSLAS
jgi:hypothetical protein